MGEAKRRMESGVEVPSREVRIGVVATWWDRAPTIGTATALLTTDVATLKALREQALSMPVDELVGSLRYAFENNLQMTNQDNMALLISAYASRTRSFERMLGVGLDGLWIKILAKGEHTMARPSVISSKDRISEAMDLFRNGQMNREQIMTFVFSDHPDDVSFTGGPEMLVIAEPTLGTVNAKDASGASSSLISHLH